jgi:adenine-specific DNA-methyltransferase
MTNEEPEIEKLDLNSMNIVEEKKKELLRLFPEIRTEGGKIDFDKLKLVLGEMIDVGKERYGMNWPGKAECFKTIQMPSLGTLLPQKEISLNFNITENIYIEGDNLEVLKLLQKSYFGKVKLIYIDPPYNTGNEFIYPDNFGESLETYLKYTGQKDAEGKKFGTNLETDGRFHSKWLNMMFPRLFLARNLLSENGIIFISIDDNEYANLKKICDEIFGEENFVTTICHKARASVSNDKIISENHNFILFYAKSYNNLFINRSEFGLEPNLSGFDEIDSKGAYKLTPVDGPGGSKKGNPYYEFKGITGYWRYSKETMQELYDKGLIVVTENNLQKKTYLEEQKHKRSTVTTWWDDNLYTSTATARLKKLMGGTFFDNPKPVELITKMLELHCREHGDIVLDFFSGSATVGHAVLEQNKKDLINRKFILVQLPEVIDKDHDGYGKGYKNISEVAIERLKKAIKQLGITNDGFKVFKLSDSNFKSWSQDADSKDGLTKQLELHVDHVKHGRTAEDILYEILLKSGFPLTTKIEPQKFGNQTVYSIAGGMLLVCLEDNITLDLIKYIADQRPERVVCLDRGFANNDQIKVNAVQIFKAKGIAKFQTI